MYLIRQHFSVLIIALFLLVLQSATIHGQSKSASTSAAINVKVVTPGSIPDRIMLSWEADPSTSMSMSWRTDRSVDDQVVEYALATDGTQFRSKTTTVDAKSESLRLGKEILRYHSATVTELSPDTKYVYRVGTKNNWSEWSHFTTATAKPSPFSFIYVGDAQNSIKAHWSRVIREAYQHAPKADFVLHAGDLVNDANFDTQWAEWFYATGFIHRSTPALATPGNHEYTRYAVEGSDTKIRGLSKLWRPTFAFPENGPESVKESAYFLDYQGVRFVSLNSNEHTDDQVKWLRKVLAENDQKWTILFFHHPIFSNVVSRDNKALRNLWQPVFDEFKVDLVLQGHDHSYSRTGKIVHETNVVEGTSKQDQHGTVYVVSVSGPKMYPGIPRPVFKKTAINKQLFQVISVDGDVLKFEARTAVGTLYDSFTLTKVEGKPNQLTENE